MKDMGDLTGRVAIVTGGGGGIGGACCDVLAMHGAIVVAADISLAAAQRTADRVAAEGGQSFAAELNVNSLESCQKLMKEVNERYGRIDILINIAGILSGIQIPDITVEDWDRMLDINLRGVHFCMQSVLPYMKERRSGAIVNIASQAGQVGGWLGSCAYSASKGGILALTKAYARHCGPYGIRVNDVAPGLIATELTASRGDKPTEIPVGRLGTAQDVANAFYFLASDLSAFITGTTIDVNGGQFMRS